MITRETFNKISDAINNHDAQALSSFYAEDAVSVDPFYPEPLRGRAAVEKDISAFFRAFPDMKTELRTFIPAENTVALEWTVTGTNEGVLSGPEGDIPPSGKKVSFEMASFCRLNDAGEIIEEHRYYDVAKIMDQLKVVH